MTIELTIYIVKLLYTIDYIHSQMTIYNYLGVRKFIFGVKKIFVGILNFFLGVWNFFGVSGKFYFELKKRGVAPL